MTVNEDQVEFENGHQGIYGIVLKDDFALIVPFDREHFYLVKQFRYAIQKDSWEFPQGKHEGDSSIDPTQLAKSELKEETGLLSNDIQEIGFFHEAPGYCNQGFHIFLAQDLHNGKQELEETEADLKVKRVTVNQFEEMVKNGEITDAPTISAFGLLKIKGII